jgi:hypothetical protein
MAAHEHGAKHTDHADGHQTPSALHEHLAHHHAGITSPDETTQTSSDHPSKTCCTACTVASPLPRITDTIVEFIVSATVYTNSTRFDVTLTIPVDPGIPKRTG